MKWKEESVKNITEEEEKECPIVTNKTLNCVLFTQVKVIRNTDLHILKYIYGQYCCIQ